MQNINIAIGSLNIRLAIKIFIELFIIFGGAYALYTVGMAIATELDYRAVNKK